MFLKGKIKMKPNNHQANTTQNKNDFAIESFISSIDSRRGLMANGYFLIKIKGTSYGVKEYDASALSGLYDGVIRRLEMRGKHIPPAELIKLPSLELAQIIYSSLFYKISDEQNSWKYHIPRDTLAKMICKNNLIWAPDDNEAFDDGSNVFQFDIDEKTVRLIGFKDTNDYKVVESTLNDLTMNSNVFYSTLKEWADNFYNKWQISCSANKKRSKVSNNLEK